MSNPTEPDRPDETTDEVTGPHEQDEHAPHSQDERTEVLPESEHEPATEVMAPADPNAPGAQDQPEERRFTAPSGFDAGSTQVINRPSEPPTEVFTAQKAAGPQEIPPRGDSPKPPGRKRSWGWVVAIAIIVVALAAIAVLGTLLITRSSAPQVSQEDMVRSTIEDFDVAVQNGDLAALRSKCETDADRWFLDERLPGPVAHARVSAAKQYPVVASIDQVVVNGDHAEANVTTFMAYAPQTRSTRSFDLQFRDDQWKICQAPTG